MFSGRYLHTVDAKGRVSFPARFREQLGQLGDDRIVLANHPNDQIPCLEAWPVSAWQRIVRKAQRLPRLDDHTQYLLRWYISSALECGIDPQGRILVPPLYREHAQLAKEALWSGVADHLELWARDQWERHIITLRESRSFDLSVLNPVFEIDEPDGDGEP